MPLSEHEQRLLDQMERALYAEDPKFATSMRNPNPLAGDKRRIALGRAGLPGRDGAAHRRGRHQARAHRAWSASWRCSAASGWSSARCGPPSPPSRLEELPERRGPPLLAARRAGQCHVRAGRATAQVSRSPNAWSAAGAAAGRPETSRSRGSAAASSSDAGHRPASCFVLRDPANGRTLQTSDGTHVPARRCVRAVMPDPCRKAARPRSPRERAASVAASASGRRRRQISSWCSPR